MKTTLFIMIPAGFAAISASCAQEDTIKEYAARVSKMDIGYRVLYKNKDPIPYRIDILFVGKDENNAIKALGSSIFTRDSTDVNDNSRIHFILDRPKEHSSITLPENNNKLRLFDTKNNKSIWVDVDEFIQMVKLLSMQKNK